MFGKWRVCLGEGDWCVGLDSDGVSRRLEAFMRCVFVIGS